MPHDAAIIQAKFQRRQASARPQRSGGNLIDRYPRLYVRAAGLLRMRAGKEARSRTSMIAAAVPKRIRLMIHQSGQNRCMRAKWLQCLEGAGECKVVTGRRRSPVLHDHAIRDVDKGQNELEKLHRVPDAREPAS